MAGWFTNGCPRLVMSEAGADGREELSWHVHKPSWQIANLMLPLESLLEYGYDPRRVVVWFKAPAAFMSGSHGLMLGQMTIAAGGTAAEEQCAGTRFV
jgi:hypothetical protein